MSQASTLRELLAAGDELTIVRHDDPDPDCPASALATTTR
jgi:nanoRNase/pAp phosphatase (c-di-AMP/oligoRNAs hydrolase)